MNAFRLHYPRMHTAMIFLFAAAALVSGYYGYKLILILALVGIYFGTRNRSHRPSARGVARAQDERDNTIRDPTNLSSPFGDYDPDRR
jgi:uncharacterized membrane protein